MSVLLAEERAKRAKEIEAELLSTAVANLIIESIRSVADEEAQSLWLTILDVNTMDLIEGCLLELEQELSSCTDDSYKTAREDEVRTSYGTERARSTGGRRRRNREQRRSEVAFMNARNNISNIAVTKEEEEEEEKEMLLQPLLQVTTPVVDICLQNSLDPCTLLEVTKDSQTIIDLRLPSKTTS